MSAIEQEIREKVQALPPEKQQEILRFIETLEQQPKPRLSIFDQIDEIISEVPPEAWAEVPTDASENLDHYLYGAPKKERWPSSAA